MPPDRSSRRSRPPPPFDLDGLNRVIDKDAEPEPAANRKWYTPWRRHDRTKPPPEMLRQSRPTATRAVLALTPDDSLSDAIREALHRTIAPRGVRPRIVLRAELPLADVEIWERAVAEVTGTLQPFVVRLVAPEVVQDRMLGLRVAGHLVADLQHALDDKLTAAGFPDQTGVRLAPMMFVGSTFAGLTVHELHALSGAIRDEFELPIEFEVRSVFVYGESATEYDLPLAAFALGQELPGA